MVVCAVSSSCLSCFSNPNGGGSNGSSKELEFNLVEVSGEWSFQGVVSFENGCAVTTDESRVTLSLTTPQVRALTFDPEDGDVVARYPDIVLTKHPAIGQEVCTGTPEGCSNTSNHQPETSSMSFSLDPLALGDNPPDGLAFIPIIRGVELPRHCDGTWAWPASAVYMRAKPVSVAQLKSGRFVVEGSGSVEALPIEYAAPNAANQGTFTYDFRFVFQTADYDPANAVEAPVLTTWDHCLATVEPTVDDLLAAQATFASGSDDVALNNTGCVHLKVARQNGAMTITHETIRGTRLVYDASSDSTRSEPDAVASYLVTYDSLGEHEQFDHDLDGTFDQVTERLETNGVWTQTISTQGDERITQTATDAGLMQVRIEQGTEVIDEFETTTIQYGCYTKDSPPNPQCAIQLPADCSGGTIGECSTGQKDDITKKIMTALAQGTKCMKAAGYNGFQPKDKALTIIASDNIKFRCDTTPCNPDIGSYNPPTRTLTLNLTRPASEQTSTIFHELLHSDPGFTHQGVEKAAGKICKKHLADKTSACEEMCFGDPANKPCACARCLANNQFGPPSQAVCDKCARFGATTDCNAPQGVLVDGGYGQLSQSVGAYCERAGMFCDTQTECQSNPTCSSIGGGCKRIKTTCDGECN